jgi:glycosyltransferase involved in cell wall biosynthesis
MKIALATHQATAILRGGPRTQVLQTASELQRLGHEVRLFDAFTEVRKGDFDLVHIFGAGLGTYHLARALHVQKIPMIVSPIYITRRPPWQVRTLRAVESAVRRVYASFWTDYAMIAEMCSWARVVAPNTQEEAALFHEAFGVPQDRLAVVPNGVEERFRRAEPALFVERYERSGFVLSVGHIAPSRKNVMRLVEALEGIDRSAVIIGRVEETREAADVLARSRRNPRLLILDHLDHDSDLLASAYAACDTFALPSLFETPGIAALEAGLSGAKVVITPHGGPREYFGTHADYVDPYSVDDIRRRIQAALDRPRDGALADHIAGRFLWKHVARRTAEVYEAALGRSSA